MSKELRRIGVGFAALTLCASGQVARTQEAIPHAAMQLASIEPQHQISSALLGKPVLVSRSDVESSSARARSVAIIEGPNQPQTPVADPAFKAVLLTPRGSTGRPVQLDMG